MRNRIIQLEDTPEISIGKPCPSDLLKLALRMKPTKIILNDCSFLLMKTKHRKFRKKKPQFIRIEGLRTKTFI
jgi:hypothetical protein